MNNLVVKYVYKQKYYTNIFFILFLGIFGKVINTYQVYKKIVKKKITKKLNSQDYRS